MNLDRIFHETKTFGELSDADMETFLRRREFRREHLNLEFKREFPTKNGGKYNLQEICKFIVGFSNEESGVVPYGVRDSIRNPEVTFDEYVCGVERSPTVEDLSQWSTRVTPLVQSPAIREFTVEGKKIVILKLPEGTNRPYAYVDPGTKGMLFYKKTAGGIQELKPDEVKEMYWTAILQQSERIVRAGLLRGMDVDVPRPDPFAAHRKNVLPLLEDPDTFGRVGIYCVPDSPVDIPVNELQTFLERSRGDFSEALRFCPTVEVFQNGVTAGCFLAPSDQTSRSTSRVTLYRDGMVAYDSQADVTMDKNGNFNPFWLSYEVQRHLQLAKSLFEGKGVHNITVTIDLDHLENFAMRCENFWAEEIIDGKYSGSHDQIRINTPLVDINSHVGRTRNIVFPQVRGIVDEVCRIFGLAGAPSSVWEADGTMPYVTGLENQR